MTARDHSSLLRPTRRQVIGAATGAAGLIAAGAVAPMSAVASSASPSAQPRAMDTSRARRWAADTWRSGRHDRRANRADGRQLRRPLRAGDRSGYTSPTNIGGYLWSAIVARELGLISRGRVQRPAQRRRCSTLDRMPQHKPSGMYYNWYTRPPAMC